MKEKEILRRRSWEAWAERIISIGRERRRMAFADCTADNVASAICILQNFMTRTMTTIYRKELKHTKIIEVIERKGIGPVMR